MTNSTVMSLSVLFSSWCLRHTCSIAMLPIYDHFTILAYRPREWSWTAISTTPILTTFGRRIKHQSIGATKDWVAFRNSGLERPYCIKQMKSSEVTAFEKLMLFHPVTEGMDDTKYESCLKAFVVVCNTKRFSNCSSPWILQASCSASGSTYVLQKTTFRTRKFSLSTFSLKRYFDVDSLLATLSSAGSDQFQST